MKRTSGLKSMLSGAFAMCIAVLFLQLSFNKTKSESCHGTTKEVAVNVFHAGAEDFLLSHAPVSVPSPAVSDRKSVSVRSFTSSNFFQLVPSVPKNGQISQFSYCVSPQVVSTQPLHLALRVLRI